MPVTMKQREVYSDRKVEALAVRRRKQSIEGSQAMADYLRTQNAVRERMAALREERLAREAATKI
jgi:hypothetical protein